MPYIFFILVVHTSKSQWLFEIGAFLLALSCDMIAVSTKLILKTNKSRYAFASENQ